MTIENARLDNMERLLVSLTQQVGRVAESMERLAVMEERNSVMSKAQAELRADMKEESKTTKTDFQKLADKYDALSTRVTSLTVAMGVVSALVSTVAPFVIKFFIGA